MRKRRKVNKLKVESKKWNCIISNYPVFLITFFSSEHLNVAWIFFPKYPPRKVPRVRYFACLIYDRGYTLRIKERAFDGIYIFRGIRWTIHTVGTGQRRGQRWRVASSSKNESSTAAAAEPGKRQWQFAIESSSGTYELHVNYQLAQLQPAHTHTFIGDDLYLSIRN